MLRRVGNSGRELRALRLVYKMVRLFGKESREIEGRKRKMNMYLPEKRVIRYTSWELRTSEAVRSSHADCT